MRNGRAFSLRGVAGWTTLIVVVAAWTHALWNALAVTRAHAYSLLPLSPNGWAAIHDAAQRDAFVAAVALLVLALPARAAAAGRLRRIVLARAWALLAVGGVWAGWGLRYNRYTLGAAWRESVEVGPLTLPRALTEPGPLATNVGVTLLAFVLFLLVARGLRSAIARLRVPTLAPSVVRASLMGLGLLVLLAAIPVSFGRPRPAFPGDVVLISLDATRADRLGCYGGPTGLTPNLDRLATESELFARAYCQEPWTLTSHMSMLTGLYPDAHGLDFGRSLAPRIWTLPERLRDAGLRTLGSVYDCFLLEERFGYGAGFDRYEITGERAQARAERAASWIEEQERPAFLFLHFYDPHSDTGVLPYEASEPHLSRFAPGATEGFAEWTGPGGASETLRRVNEEGLAIDDSLRFRLRRLYDAGLAETDAAVGTFLDRLRSAGRFEEALIVVVADHGEALGEADHFMHERLMEETLRVPLLVKWPRSVRGAVVRGDLVETVDLLPTVLVALGLEPEPISQGNDLAVDPSGRSLALHRSGPLHAVTTGDGWRLLYRWTEAAGVDPVALRRAGDDPGDGPERPDQLGEFLDLWAQPIGDLHRANALIAARFAGAKVTMGKADEELLRSLGYID